MVLSVHTEPQNLSIVLSLSWGRQHLENKLAVALESLGSNPAVASPPWFCYASRFILFVVALSFKSSLNQSVLCCVFTPLWLHQSGALRSSYARLLFLPDARAQGSNSAQSRSRSNSNKTCHVDTRSYLTTLNKQNISMWGASPEVNRSEVFRGCNRTWSLSYRDILSVSWLQLLGCAALWNKANLQRSHSRFTTFTQTTKIRN